MIATQPGITSLTFRTLCLLTALATVLALVRIDAGHPGRSSQDLVLTSSPDGCSPNTPTSGWAGQWACVAEGLRYVRGSLRECPAEPRAHQIGALYNLGECKGMSRDKTYHVAVTFDGTTARMYINGQQVGSVAQTGSLSPGVTDLTIGRPDYPRDRWDGLIDEVAMYPDALSPSRLTAHYLAGTASGGN